jgi:hypothetical protein
MKIYPFIKFPERMYLEDSETLRIIIENEQPACTSAKGIKVAYNDGESHVPISVVIYHSFARRTLININIIFFQQLHLS